MQYKRKHRLSAALMAGAMCCTMIPTASADEVATPETAETTATEAVSQSEQPVRGRNPISDVPQLAADGHRVLSRF